eukprot:3382050-Pyramimonas_sp.AAC.1
MVEKKEFVDELTTAEEEEARFTAHTLWNVEAGFTTQELSVGCLHSPPAEAEAPPAPPASPSPRPRSAAAWRDRSRSGSAAPPLGGSVGVQ